MVRSFFGFQIKEMNQNYPFNGSIINARNLYNNRIYTLHATGECDITNGRYYIAKSYTFE